MGKLVILVDSYNSSVVNMPEYDIILGNKLPGNIMIDIKPIHPDYIDAIKTLADANRSSLGFMPRKKLEEIAEQQRGIVAIQDEIVVGFVFFRHRKIDLQTTLSEICVQKDYQGQHIGTQLVQALIHDCKQKTREFIQLKCPVDLPANTFYERLGFKVHTVEDGKKRQLKVWRLIILVDQSG